MSDEIFLKPCPFCGSNNVKLVYMSEINGEEYCIDSEEELENSSLYTYINCYDCDVNVFMNAAEKPKGVLKAWNKRTYKKGGI